MTVGMWLIGIPNSSIGDGMPTRSIGNSCNDGTSAYLKDIDDEYKKIGETPNSTIKSTFLLLNILMTTESNKIIPSVVAGGE